MKPPPSHLHRGAVLIVVMLVAALIAFMLGSYLDLSLNSARFSNRTFYENAAFNLVESGAEEAVWSFNRTAQSAPDGWSTWSHNNSDAWQKFDGFKFTANTTGWVKVYVENYSSSGVSSPKVIALASVSPITDAPITKMLEVTLSRRSHFAGGLVAKNSITFNGQNATVDSWNSDPDNDSTTPPVPYSAAVRNDHGSVASASMQNTAMLINQADIWGYASTGGAAPQVGVNGSIRGATTPIGVQIDPSRVSTDFSANFDPVAAPSGGVTLASLGPTLGTLGTSTSWRCASVALSGNKSLTILGQVTLVLTASSGAQALAVTGNAIIHIPVGSSLALYAEGDIKIAGNGLGNDNVQPISCQLWGTNTSDAGQAIDVVGNGALKSVVYAPNATVKLNGNSEMMGSVVARDIVIVGNANFHYDESLALYGDAGFGVAKWRELATDAARSPYLPLMNGW